MELKVKKLTPDAIIPARAHATDAGLDLYANEDVIIAPGETKVVKTGISIQLPENTVGDVRPRSGITSKTKLRVQLGTVDEGYTGEVGVILDNTFPVYQNSQPHAPLDVNNKEVLGVPKKYTKGTYLISKGTKIAQLVILPVLKPEIIEVAELDGSDRGEAGFGSTGTTGV